MKLTGKCKEAFISWIQKEVEKSDTLRDICNLHGIIEIPDSMQIGVYEDFFDSVGFHPDNYYCPSVKAYSWDVHYGDGEEIRCGDYMNTRPEARTSAILQANELLNNR